MGLSLRSSWRQRRSASAHRKVTGTFRLRTLRMLGSVAPLPFPFLPSPRSATTRARWPPVPGTDLSGRPSVRPRPRASPPRRSRAERRWLTRGDGQQRPRGDVGSRSRFHLCRRPEFTRCDPHCGFERRGRARAARRGWDGKSVQRRAARGRGPRDHQPRHGLRSRAPRGVPCASWAGMGPVVRSRLGRVRHGRAARLPGSGRSSG